MQIIRTGIIIKNMQIIKLNPQEINQKQLNLVIDYLKQGKVVLFPTDTVYGFLADATNKKAVKKIFKIKKRPLEKPLPLFVKDIKMAKVFAKICPQQEKFLKIIWSSGSHFQKNESSKGKVTVILEGRKTKEKIYSTRKDTIALRIPCYQPLNLLLNQLDFPLAQTSANISGKPASGRIKEIIKEFKEQENQPDLIVNAGNLPHNKPSTIIDLTTIPPKILRS